MVTNSISILGNGFSIQPSTTHVEADTYQCTPTSDNTQTTSEVRKWLAIYKHTPHGHLRGLTSPISHSAPQGTTL